MTPKLSKPERIVVMTALRSKLFLHKNKLRSLEEEEIGYRNYEAKGVDYSRAGGCFDIRRERLPEFIREQREKIRETERLVKKWGK